MIKKLVIYDLFGVEGNVKTIDFKDNLTILVGKNGCGKTTVLNILNAIITKSYNKLLKYNFKKIIFESDEGNIVVSKLPNSLEVKRMDILNNLM